MHKHSIIAFYMHVHGHTSCFIHQCPLGDFHFMWECLRKILSCYWGNASTPGSPYHLHVYVRSFAVISLIKEERCSALPMNSSRLASRLTYWPIYATNFRSAVHLTLSPHMSGSNQQLNTFCRGVYCQLNQWTPNTRCIAPFFTQHSFTMTSRKLFVKRGKSCD